MLSYLITIVRVVIDRRRKFIHRKTTNYNYLNLTLRDFDRKINLPADRDRRRRVSLLSRRVIE